MLPSPFVWVKRRPKELFIESFSNAERTLQIRGFTSNEQIIADHTTNSDRSLATSVVPITGIPISLTVTLSTTGVRRGECYVRISVRVEGVVIAMLGAGYVSDTGTIVFPGGKIESSIEGPGLTRSFTGTDPAANTDIFELVPTGALWRLQSMIATLVADANPANRAVTIRLKDGPTQFLIVGSDEIHLANETRTYMWFQSSRTTDSIGGVVASNLPQGLVLPAGFVITTFTVGRQVGDNWSAPQLLIEEWIQP